MEGSLQKTRTDKGTPVSHMMAAPSSDLDESRAEQQYEWTMQPFLNASRRVHWLLKWRPAQPTASRRHPSISSMALWQRDSLKLASPRSNRLGQVIRRPSAQKLIE